MTYLERNNKRRVCTICQWPLRNSERCPFGKRTVEFAHQLKGKAWAGVCCWGEQCDISCERTLCEIFWWGRCRPVSFVSIKSVVRWVGQLGSKMQKSKKFKQLSALLSPGCGKKLCTHQVFQQIIQLPKPQIVTWSCHKAPARILGMGQNPGT